MSPVKKIFRPYKPTLHNSVAFNLRRRARLREHSASMDAPMNEMMTIVTFMLSKGTKLTWHTDMMYYRVVTGLSLIIIIKKKIASIRL